MLPGKRHSDFVKRISDALLFIVLVILCAGAICCHMNQTACRIVACLMKFRRTPAKHNRRVRRLKFP